MKKNILLTGAAGAVGFETLKQLLILLQEFNIRVFELKNKKSKRKLQKYSSQVEIIYGDLRTYEEVEKACEGIDFVIHLAAIIPPLADENPNLATAVNVDGTNNIIKALIKKSPNAKLLYSSSVSVYGDRVETPQIAVNDQLSPSPRDEYAVTKIKAEELVRNSGLDWTIFRLSAIFGYRNHKIEAIMFHMPLPTPMEITTASDTGRAMTLAVGKFNELKGKVFNLGGGENCRVSYREFLTEMFKIYGLGNLNFPDKAFADKNFHCAYYADGDDLENILKFRRDTIKVYFENMKNNVNPFIYFITKLFQKQIKKFLLNKSEPYKAYLENNEIEIKHYFKN